MKNKNLKIILSIWTYLGWFGCVYFGKMNWGLASLIFPVISWSLLHLSFHLNRKMVIRLLTLFIFGFVFDSVAVGLNWIHLNPVAEVGLLPVWMISLWLLFVSSLPLLQSLFQKKYFLSSLLGAVMGPLSYRAGAQFGVLLLDSQMALLIYAAYWAIYIPSAIIWLEKK